MLAKLSDVLAKDLKFRPSWKAQPPDCIAKDDRFGMIMHVVSCNSQGQPRYDFPLWLERSGAVCLPIDHDGKIVLLRNYRPALASPSRHGEFPLGDLDGLGRPSLELPRGFPEIGEAPADAARREVEEETGISTSEAVFLGTTNSNTTFFPFSNHVYLVRVDSRRKSQNAAEQNDERIDAVLLLTMSEVLQKVANGEILCGMTKSALMSYLAWCETGQLDKESAASPSRDSQHE